MHTVRRSKSNPKSQFTTAQEPKNIIQDWRSSVLNILLPVVTIAILPALIQTIYQVFIYHTVGWLGPAIYALFYLCLVYVTIRRDLDPAKRGWALVVLTFLTGVISMERGGLSGDGRVYLAIVPLLAITLINMRTGIYAAAVCLLVYAIFGFLAAFGILEQWLIRPDNPLDGEYWFYNGLMLATIVIAVVFVVARFVSFQIGTLESFQKMAEELGKAYKQLEASNQALEQRVRQRTQQLMLANRRLEFLATHDNLTGLPNRLLLYDRLDQAIRKSQRSHSKFALFFIDLDDFKQVNDSFGHAVGDCVLQTVSGILSQSVRGSDTVSRLAGDEFALILYDVHGLEDIEAVVHKIASSLSQPLQVLDGKVSITASIGVSLFPDHGSEPDFLLRKADQAMYAAKNAGKNKYMLAE
jgi:diguanylate cyclase (GGDEF)-like protein